MTVDRSYVHQRAAVPRAVVDGGLELVCQELHDPAAGGRGHMGQSGKVMSSDSDKPARAPCLSQSRISTVKPARRE